MNTPWRGGKAPPSLVAASPVSSLSPPQAPSSSMASEHPGSGVLGGAFRLERAWGVLERVPPPMNLALGCSSSPALKLSTLQQAQTGT